VLCGVGEIRAGMGTPRVAVSAACVSGNRVNPRVGGSVANQCVQEIRV